MPDMLPKIVPENAERVVMLAPLVHQQVATYLARTPQALLSAPDASNVMTLQGSQLRPLSSASIIPNTCFTLPTHRDGVDLTDRPAPVADLVSLLPDVSDCRPRAQNVVSEDLASQFDSMGACDVALTDGHWSRHREDRPGVCLQPLVHVLCVTKVRDEGPRTTGGGTDTAE